MQFKDIENKSFFKAHKKWQKKQLFSGTSYQNANGYKKKQNNKSHLTHALFGKEIENEF